ncbi:Xanthine dehydrogenase, FAD binding subunit [Pseudonocardia sp. Ae168_Ps1]|uniref:FAD binding domain-containing protein n=1 Tax=unclassified Pseudonocardia TaxID=2619320 RepID=UPI00094B1E69|nr:MULTISPECIES: FAD binding domain-containing protein [unclassified Pseudonocardia]OLL71764.1 Xanthine dehydrogenase, FAD binding subunit [Pseudonocardia sp. Ae150A_Ps1]OLL77732.1 Xanthine dehydrogenase, FAD binding subunit [Pseudonocardia sp. Ae168_Ps1]OLL88145.1 Xanthine dehydrogenase, FAD binding subunit [Pseudonocardia sp. Ae263_Ps1]OLL91829.1 Xanthine dehydrogenase, FAD binding subunit [Pseudonocardia sp. Ae356_Ps1]
MDLHTVTTFRRARSRGDLALAPGERILGGGTWLFSEPQPDTTGLVDLTTMGWEPVVVRPDDGLEIAATCTIAELAAFGERTGRPLLAQCAHALLASYKIWHTATVGGNVCRSFAAAGMVALCVALDGAALVWTPDGGTYRVPVAQLVTGNGTNALRPGEVLRSLELPAHALSARTAFRKIALAELGRSGAVLTGRLHDDGGCVFGITAATAAPTVLRYPALPGTGRLRADVAALDGWYTDPLGTAGWRRQVSGVLLAEIHEELAA